MRVLVVEDSETTTSMVARALEEWGHEVACVFGGVQALERIEQGEVDLVILGGTMPDPEGLELCRRIRRADLPRYVAVIMLTDSTGIEDLSIAMEAGVDDFVSKPLLPAELKSRMQAIERLMRLHGNLEYMNTRLVEACEVANAEAERQLRNVKALLEVSRAMSSEVHLDSLLQVILKKTTEIMGAERSSLFLYDEERNELWSRIAEGLESEEIRVSVGVGIIGEAALSRQPCNIADAYDDPRFDPEFDKTTGFRTRAILCLPVLQEEKLIGVVEVLNKKGGGPFNEGDEALLGALASHAAIALERARLIAAHVEAQRAEESLRLAHDIQMSLLPSRFPPFPEHREFEVFALCETAKEVGGDLYDFFLIDEDQLGFVIADVSGKGVPAALLMARTMALARANASQGISPGKTLTWVNAQFAADNASCMFATVFCGILNFRTGMVTYSNGGHNPPYVLATGGSVSALDEVHGLPLGALEGMDYGENRIQLQPGDALFLYTDGVTEAMDSENQEFSDERLQGLLERHIGASAIEIAQAVAGEVETFCAGARQADDITALALRYLSRRRAEDESCPGIDTQE